MRNGRQSVACSSKPDFGWSGRAEARRSTQTFQVAYTDRTELGRTNRYLAESLPTWAALLLTGGAIALIAACAPHGSSVEGQVVEVSNPEAPASQWTLVPAAGAYVIVYWTGTAPGFHASTECLHAAIGKTDERGRFEIPGWWGAPKPYPVYLRETGIVAYKPGYVGQSEYRNPDAPNTRTLVRSKLPVEQRLAILSGLAEAGCHRDAFNLIPLEDKQGVAAGFYRALYDEAMALGPHPPKFNHYLVRLRAKAGIPEPPEPPWKVQILRPGGPQPAAPEPVK